MPDRKARAARRDGCLAHPAILAHRAVAAYPPVPAAGRLVGAPGVADAG